MMNEKETIPESISESIQESILKLNNKKASKSKVLEKGPLESMIPGSTSKILDFLSTYKDWDYSISDISRNVGLSFKTTLSEIRNLSDQEVIIKTRNVGKSNMYKLNLDSKQGQHIDKLVFTLAKNRVRVQIKQQKQVNSKTELEQANYSLKMKEIKA